jgi:hypothetical protein
MESGSSSAKVGENCSKFFKPMNAESHQYLHDLMLKAIAYSGATALRFLENPFFIQQFINNSKLD